VREYDASGTRVAFGPEVGDTLILEGDSATLDQSLEAQSR
jgi:hypothetical protein